MTRAEVESEPCGARAVAGPCVLPCGHNIGRADVPEAHLAAPETVDGQANDCTHMSATGVDTTSPTDPAKVWACDHCGLRWRQDGSGVRVAALADSAGALAKHDAEVLRAAADRIESWMFPSDARRFLRTEADRIAGDQS